MRYAFIERHKNIWPVADQCRVLEVAASGFRAWRKRQSGKPRAAPGKRVSDLALLTHIRAEFAASKQTYGWPRMVKQLHAKGLRVGKERVRKAMKSNDIRVRSRRRFKVTTDSRHDLPIASNLLKREFVTQAPNKAWVGDITYVWTAEGWLYLATVIDLFSRQVVGFAMGEHMGAQLVVDALRMAWFRRKPAPGTDLPFRPRQPIRQRRLRQAASRLCDARLHEPEGRSLGQRGRREPVRLPQDRKSSSP